MVSVGDNHPPPPLHLLLLHAKIVFAYGGMNASSAH
jgi:hypothetical protein